MHHNGSLVMEVRSSVIGGELLPCTIFVEQLSAAVAYFRGQGGRRNGCDGDDHQDQGNDTPGVFCHVFSPLCECLSAFFGTARNLPGKPEQIRGNISSNHLTIGKAVSFNTKTQFTSLLHSCEYSETRDGYDKSVN